jgi:hypothetical protein
MIPLIVLGGFVAVPVLLALIFRVNAVYIFLSICVGYFLQFALSDDVDLVLATIIRGSDTVVAARIGLLTLPVVATLFALRKTVGKSFVFQFIPLILSGMFLATLALPLLPPNFEQSVYSSQFGGGIKSSQDLIVAGAVAMNLILAWTLFKHKGDHRKHH